MLEKMAQAKLGGEHLSYISPAGSRLDKLESLFFQYAAIGSGKSRHYLHTVEATAQFDQQPGTFTE